MSIFGKIAAAIFGTGEAKAADTPAPAGTAATGAKAAAPSASAAAAAKVAAASGGKPVDVSAVLNKLAENSKEDLDWRKSIVDLMKLLDLDSSLKARKALAAELNYTGSKSDTAAMNTWLHKQVMTKLAENGGVVPAELRD